MIWNGPEFRIMTKSPYIMSTNLRPQVHHKRLSLSAICVAATIIGVSIG